ncbi:serine--tRNA ligase [Candidatus Woesearchaeota archaeon]|nr:serine--tRNA ligase [Candidatus Woesearchaeota archaeon]
MIGIRFIRENPEKIKEAVKNRGYAADIEEFLKLDEKYLASLQKVEKLKHQRNVASLEIRKLKVAGKTAAAQIKEVKEIPAKIKKLDDSIKKTKEMMNSILMAIPNIPADEVPVGGESANKEIKKFGKLPKFKFKPKPHWDIGKDLDIIDIDTSIKLSGAGFYVFKGLGARLQRALINFMLDFHAKDGFKEIVPPLLVNKKALFGTSQLPKFEADLYKTQEGLYLTPTSEVELANMHADEILEKTDLPKYYCAYTPCFRTEAGRHGTETRGIFRLHQFDKVEMVVICHPEHSWTELEMLRKRAEKILEMLEIPYRTCILSTEDMAFPSAKTYDIECWSPALEKYLEVSSVSNCTNFQARRMNTRFRTPAGNVFVHTLNGSGLALPRLIISILECCQQKDGSVKIPRVLQPYMNGVKIIEKRK